MTYPLPERQQFKLPMIMFALTDRADDGVVAHCLNFDLVTVGTTEAEAKKLLRSAVKTYIEYGISRGWEDDICFNAPREFWDRLTPDVHVALEDPIFINSSPVTVVEAKVRESALAVATR